MNRPVVVELFSGCGGMSTGLLDAGYDVRLGVDIDVPSLVAFEYNHSYRGSRSLRGDVSRLTGMDLLNAAGVDRVDLLSGGPPCQPFSIAGKRRGLDDPRGKLIAEFLRIAAELNPTAVMLENVPALATAHGGGVVRAATEELERLGYVVQWEILNAASYGVPQARKRLVLLAVRGVDTFSFPPQVTHGESVTSTIRRFRTAADAIEDIPDVLTSEGELVPNHEPTAHSPAMLAAFAQLAPGRREPRSRHDRLHPDRPGYTLRAGSGNFSPMRPIHYNYDRVVSVRESARLQGFSDDFVWPDSLSRLQQYRQVGNAVPPPLAAAVGRHLADELGWTLDPAASAGDARSRPNALTMTPEQRAHRRMRHHHGGASFGRERQDDPSVDTLAIFATADGSSPASG